MNQATIRIPSRIYKIIHERLGKGAPGFSPSVLCRVALSVILILTTITARAQYDPRISTTGPEAAEAEIQQKRERQESGGQGALVKIGRMEFSLSAGLREEYNDNIGLTQSNVQNDIISTPQLNLGIHYPLSKLNSLDISLGFAYSKYLSHSNLDTSNILIAPNSLLDLNIYTLGMRFNVHDMIAIQQDPSNVAQLSNLSTFQRLTNTAGIGVEWDLNKFILSAGYDYAIFRSLESRFQFLDLDTHTLHGQAGVRVSGTVTTGLQGSYSFTDYQQTAIQNNSQTFSGGPFVDWVITEHLKANASASFQLTTFSSGGSIGDTSSFSAPVFNLGLENELNKWMTHSLTYRRFMDLGIGSNYTDNHEVSYHAKFELIRDLDTTLDFSYNTFSDSQSLFSENADIFSVAPEAGYRLFQDLTLRLGYKWLQKASSRSGNSYDQNSVYVNVMHQF